MSEDTKKSAKKKPHRRMKAVYTKIREQVSTLYSISWYTVVIGFSPSFLHHKNALTNFFWNYLDKFNETPQDASLYDPLQKYNFVFYVQRHLWNNYKTTQTYKPWIGNSRISVKR